MACIFSTRGIIRLNQQRRDFSMSDFKDNIVLAYKLTNTISSKSFVRSLWSLWIGAESQGLRGDNVMAIHCKMSGSLLTKLDRFCRHESFDGIFAYLDRLAVHGNITLRRSDKSGTVKSFGVTEYKLFSEFVYNFSIHFRPSGSLQSDQFNCHELLWEIANYLMVKNTIEHGSGFSRYDDILESMLSNKPTDFFKNGYISDFFIHDRITLLTDKDVRFIASQKSYLSTTTMTESVRSRAIFSDDFEIFKLA